MVTINPARFLGIDEFTGSLSLGKDADFIIVDDRFELIETYVHREKMS